MLDRRKALQTAMAVCVCGTLFEKGWAQAVHIGARTCRLRAGSAAVGVSSLRASQRSGNVYLDRLMPQEAKLLSQYFGVDPGFLFIDDESPNAFATEDTLVPGHSGTVLFGRRLIRSETATALGGNALIAIMAHEWGHILQYANNIHGPSKKMELCADYMAGWWFGIKSIHNTPLIGLEVVARSLFAKGDFAFNSADHHGTPEERVQAMVTGLNVCTVRGVLASDDAMSVGARLFGLTQ